MIRFEGLHEPLRPFADENYRTNLGKQLSKLPGDVLPHARALLYLDQDGSPISPENLDSSDEKAATTLGEGAADTRRQVLELLLPKLVDDLEDGLEMLLMTFPRPLPHRFAKPVSMLQLKASGDYEYEMEPMTALRNLYTMLPPFNPDAAWVAGYGDWIWCGRGVGVTLAAAMNRKDDTAGEVAQILRAAVKNEHELAQLTRETAQALLLSDDPENWEFLAEHLAKCDAEDDLVAYVMGAMKTPRPESFAKMLRVIVENDLHKDADMLNEFGEWLNMEDASEDELESAVVKLLPLIEDEKQREKALKGDDAEAAYLALWAWPIDDIETAFSHAAELLKDSRPEHRFAAGYMLLPFASGATSWGQFRPAAELLLQHLSDEDDRIAALALESMSSFGSWVLQDVRKGKESVAHLAGPGVYDDLQKLLDRAPKKATTLESPIWPWRKLQLSVDEVIWRMTAALGQRSASELAPLYSQMKNDMRADWLEAMRHEPDWSAEACQMVAKAATEKKKDVAEAAMEAIDKHGVPADQVDQFAPMFESKSSDLRKALLRGFMKLDDQLVIASAENLLGEKKAPLRTAGLELLRQLVERSRSKGDAQRAGKAFSDSAKKLTNDEQRHLDVILAGYEGGAAAADENESAAADQPATADTPGNKEKAAPTPASNVAPSFDNALGLIDENQLVMPAPEPLQPAKVDLVTKATIALLKSIDELVEKHCQREVEFFDREDGIEIMPLEDASGYDFINTASVTGQFKAEDVPLMEMWQSWYDNRPKACRDDDSLEIVRALAAVSYRNPPRPRQDKWYRKLAETVLPKPGELDLKHRRPIEGILHCVFLANRPDGADALIVNAAEAVYTMVPLDEAAPKEYWDDFRIAAVGELSAWPGMGRFAPSPKLDDALFAVRWRVERWLTHPLDQKGNPHEAYEQREVSLWELAEGQKRGLVDEAVILQRLCTGTHYLNGLCHVLEKRDAVAHEYPMLAEAADKVRRRIVELELARGLEAGPSTRGAVSLVYAGDAETLLDIVDAMDSVELLQEVESPSEDMSRDESFTWMIQHTWPNRDQTPEKFAKMVKARNSNLDELEKISIAVPRWVDHVEAALGRDGRSDAVWWVHAHAREAHIDNEELDREIGRRSMIDPEDLSEGTVDVAWFDRFYQKLGDKHWKEVVKSAKFAKRGSDYKRPLLFAEAILGELDEQELITQIQKKRKQDAVRSLGLIPLPEKPKDREAAIAARYDVFQEFLRTGKKFGSQRRENEALAVSIGMANLARTAGYADPMRLQWEMETKAVADLAEGPQEVKVDDLAVSLSIDDQGQPQLAVMRGKKSLKSIPAKMKKNEQIAEVIDREKQLKKTGPRIRKTLEQAMIRKETFSQGELRGMMKHPIIRGMARGLVFIGEGIAGYPVDDGQGLIDHSGKIEPIKKDEPLRIAHPFDLHQSGDWERWQHDCFARERIQPFKQVFRELYLPTQKELESKAVSTGRYADLPVDPDKAAALLKSRGWVGYEIECVEKTDHATRITATLGNHTSRRSLFDSSGDDARTVGAVQFYKRGEYKDIPLAEVRPVLFSEIMRDLDLATSVAAASGRAESSAATMQMRAALVRETAELLGLGNVTLDDHRVRITGQLSSYTVHLGSGVIHQASGAAVVILADPADRKEKLFLPFADDDKITAEIIAKVLLLAADEKIKDKDILAQISTPKATS